MQPVSIDFCWLDSEASKDLPLPTYHSDLAAGMDVAAAVTNPETIAPGEIKLINTGFAVALPPGYELQVRPRSGLAIKHGISIINSPGTIDADYRGEIKIGLINLSQTPYTFSRGDRIAQLILSQVNRADLKVTVDLDKTTRQSGGFGHTGV